MGPRDEFCLIPFSPLLFSESMSPFLREEPPVQTAGSPRGPINPGGAVGSLLKLVAGVQSKPCHRGVLIALAAPAGVQAPSQLVRSPIPRWSLRLEAPRGQGQEGPLSLYLLSSYF